MRRDFDFAANEDGAAALEYCVLAAGIAAAIVAAIFALGPAVESLYLINFPA